MSHIPISQSYIYLPTFLPSGSSMILLRAFPIATLDSHRVSPIKYVSKFQWVSNINESPLSISINLCIPSMSPYPIICHEVYTFGGKDVW